MAERRWKIGKVELIFFKSEKLTKILIAVVIALSTAALAALSWAGHQFQNGTEALRAEAAQIEYDNQVLEAHIDELGSVRSVERIAREELGMVSADTVLIEAQVK